MRKKYFFLIVLIFIFFLVSGCNRRGGEVSTEIPSTTTSTPAKLSYLSVENDQYERAYQGVPYMHGARLIIWAHYDDKTKTDVTSKATFTLDTQKVGNFIAEATFENKSVRYSVEVLEKKLTSIYLDITNAKTLYNVGESFTTEGLVVTAMFTDGSLLNVKDYHISMKLNGYPKTMLSKAGLYDITISYQGFSSSYQVTARGFDMSVIYEKIELETMNVKTSFANEKFNYDNLVVKGVVNEFDIDVLDEDQYVVQLFYDDFEVQEFDRAGNYMVKVTYVGAMECASKEATYEIVYRNYSKDTIHLNFKYSKESLGTFQREVDVDNIDPEKFIILPEGYAFIGFDQHDWSNLKDNETIVINVVSTSLSKSVIAFLNSDWTLFEVTEVINNIQIKLPTSNPTYIGTGTAKFVKWDLKNNAMATTDRYILPVFEMISGFVSPRISIIDSTSIQIDIPKFSGVINMENSTIYLADSNGNNIRHITDFSTVIYGLDISQKYTLYGSYEGKRGADTVKATILTMRFTTTSYTTTSKYEPLVYVSEIHGNSIEFNFTNLNYLFGSYEKKGILVLDEDGNTICNKVIKTNMDCFIGNLDASKIYSYQIYYLDGDVLLYTRSQNIVCTGENKYEINLTYQNEVIKSYYVKEGESIDHPYDFTLPESLADYKIAGSFTSIHDIHSDLNCELVLIPVNEEDSFSVIFYDRFGTIIKYAKAQKGQTVTPPNYQEEYEENGVRYQFLRWDKDYVSIMETTFIKPVFIVKA